MSATGQVMWATPALAGVQPRAATPPPRIHPDASAIVRARACTKSGCSCQKAARAGTGNTHCPTHNDPNPSLNVAERNGTVLVKCFAGCEQRAIVAALREQELWPMSDHAPAARPTLAPQRRIVATYDYKDAAGQLVYQTCRYEPKGFAQRRPDGKDGWAWNLQDTRRVLYRLPELRAADGNDVVWIAEGEKDVDRLRALGLAATCNVGGAGKWQEEFSQELRGRRVTVLQDNDEAGRNHARQVAQCLQGVAAEVRILSLPNLPPKGDVSDWLDAGGSVEELRELAAKAPTLGAPEFSPISPTYRAIFRPAQRMMREQRLGEHFPGVKAQRAAQPIQLPDDQGIAGPEVVEGLGQLGAVVQRAAGGVDEDPITAGRLERIELQLQALVGRRDAGIPQQGSHGSLGSPGR